MAAELSVSVASVRNVQGFVRTICLVGGDAAHVERDGVLRLFSRRDHVSSRCLLRRVYVTLLINFNRVLNSFLLHHSGRCRPNKLILLDLGQFLCCNLDSLGGRIDRTNFFIGGHLWLRRNFGIFLSSCILIVVNIVIESFCGSRDCYFVLNLLNGRVSFDRHCHDGRIMSAEDHIWFAQS